MLSSNIHNQPEISHKYIDVTKDGQVKYDGYDRFLNEVPEGFRKWYETIEHNKSEISELTDMYLCENDLPNAIAIFQKVTKENISKVWH